MKPQPILAEAAPTPGGAYSHAMRVGNIVFLAGQVGVDPKTGITPDGVPAQTEQALRNLESVLHSLGSSLKSIVKTTCFLRDLATFDEFNTAYARVMGDHKPARSTIGVQLASHYLVEIEAVATLE